MGLFYHISLDRLHCIYYNIYIELRKEEKQMTIKAISEKIENTKLENNGEKVAWIGKSQAKKLAKAFNWIEKNQGIAIEVNSDNLKFLQGATNTGSEFKAINALAIELGLK
jgi:hypothetical protein